MDWTPGTPFTVPQTFASPEAFIAGRTTAEVATQLMAMDGDAMPSTLRRAIVAALEARKARKAALKSAS
jgi:hypothetical protein